MVLRTVMFAHFRPSLANVLHIGTKSTIRERTFESFLWPPSSNFITTKLVLVILIKVWVWNKHTQSWVSADPDISCALSVEHPPPRNPGNSNTRTNLFTWIGQRLVQIFGLLEALAGPGVHIFGSRWWFKLSQISHVLWKDETKSVNWTWEHQSQIGVNHARVHVSIGPSSQKHLCVVYLSGTCFRLNLRHFNRRQIYLELRVLHWWWRANISKRSESVVVANFFAVEVKFGRRQFLVHCQPNNRLEKQQKTGKLRSIPWPLRQKKYVCVQHHADTL